MRFAMEQDIHDERLWMPIARSANYRRAAAAVDIGLAVARRAEALRLHRGIGREPTVGGHEAMAAFHARAEGTLPNRCSPPLFDDDEGVWNERVPQGEQRSRRFPLSDRCNGRNEIGEVINTAQTPTSRASRVG
jgi:hypothetical protein